MSAAIHVGFFGKVPNLGDFVERRVHPGFLTVWDQWLQDGIAASREDLGDQWLDHYLVSPIWRFALSAEVCGDAVYAGVMVPSVDSVGRYFPLAVIASLPAVTPCMALLSKGIYWFKAVESTLLDILDGSLTNMDEVDRKLSALERPLTETVASLAPLEHLNAALDLTVTVADSNHFAADFIGVTEMSIRERFATPTYWLTDGSERMSARLLVVRGLPPANVFGAMLSGDFSPAAWQCVAFDKMLPASQQSAIESLAESVPALELTPLPSAGHAISSAVRSERGHVRTRNEDYAVARPDRNLWVVADGMGGYQDGALASAAVCDAVDQVEWQGDLDDKVDLIVAALRGLNSTLRAASAAASGEIFSASTVVILLIEGGEWACIWSGDSRLYRYRQEGLEQLSADHSTGERNSFGDDAQEYFVTAGIGVDEELVVDVIRGVLEPGDRFMLCTDGVYDAVAQTSLVHSISQANAQRASFELIKAVLDGPAGDNATVAVVYTE